MDRLKKIGIFVALLAVLGGGAVLLFWDLGAECRSILTSGAGEGNYLLTASDAEGGVYALGRTEKGYELVIGDLSGRRTQRWTLEDGTVPRDSTPAVLYPASGGAVYLGLYNTESGTRLQLYRLTNQGREAELLLDEACPGENLQEQMAGTRLSDFSEVDNVVTFALIQGDTAQFYQRTGSSSGLEARQETVQSGLRACAEFMASGVGFRSANEDGSIVYFAHTVSRTGTYLSKTAGVREGEALAYLIAPPLEAVVGLDEALKASDVELAALFEPPSETNFGGGLLTGTQSACNAACAAFAEAVKAVAARPREI